MTDELDDAQRFPFAYYRNGESRLAHNQLDEDGLLADGWSEHPTQLPTEPPSAEHLPAPPPSAEHLPAHPRPPVAEQLPVEPDARPKLKKKGE